LKIPVENNSRYKQGDFARLNPKKYSGKRPIFYRSSYEFRFMIKLELNPNVESWASEDLIIPYVIKEKVNGKVVEVKHNYVTDFTVKLKTGRIIIVEVKPQAFTPINESQIRRNPIMYKNACKWKAAIQYCKKMNFEFKIVTESQLATKVF